MTINMTNYMVMIDVNVHEVKAKLSEYLAKVEEGEVVRICRRNVPVAELRPLPEPAPGDRPRGRAKGMFEVPASFFEPLPDEVVDGFCGDGGGGGGGG
jgi:prevent-host-death family protein